MSAGNQNLEPNQPAIKRIRLIHRAAWVTLAIISIVVIGRVAWQTFMPEPVPTAKEVGKALIKSEFDLVNHNGERVTHKSYPGKWQLVFFGYTFCPDVCPTTLVTVSEVIDRLGEDARNIIPFFITVDPERDTAEIMADYVKAFHPKLIGLTGSVDQVQSAANSFRVYYAKAPQKDAPEDYLMAHSGYIYLMSPNGEYVSHYSDNNNTSTEIADAIHQRLNP